MDLGTALAVVSLTFQVFGGCVKGFALLSTAHNLGKDSSLLRTMLQLEEYHLVSWANKVGLTGPDAQLDPRLNHNLAANLLGQLEVLFRTDKLRERYKLDLRPEPLVLPLHASKDSRDIVSSAQGILSNIISDEMRLEILSKAKLIQSKNDLPKRLWWAAVDRGKFEAFVRDVRSIIQGLWSLLNSVQQDEVVSKVDQVLSTVVGISKDLQGLQELQSALLLNSKLTSQVPGTVVTAAGLKATRLELQDDDPSEYIVSNNFALPSSRPRRDILLPPLSASEISEVNLKSNDPSVGTAIYANKPVLIEYKTVPTRLKSKLRSRVENLAVLLHAPKSPSSMTLHCLGFFEDEERFCFVFEYPVPAIPPSTGGNSSLAKPAQPISLLDLLRDPKQQPSITSRIALSSTIASTLLALHTAGWLHKELRSENIFFFPVANTTHPNPNPTTTTDYDLLSHPYLTHFAFSRASSPAEISEQPSSSPQHDIYRHPSALGEPSSGYNAYMDLYSLGTIMIEIAEWRGLKTVIRKQVDVSKTETDVPLSEIAKIPQWLMKEKIQTGALGFRMGDIFARFVDSCLNIGTSTGEGQEHEQMQFMNSLEILREGARALAKVNV